MAERESKANGAAVRESGSGNAAVREGKLGDAAASVFTSLSEGMGELTFYLVTRLVLVLVAVMAAESLVVWAESVVLLPLLKGVLRLTEVGSLTTTSVLTLLSQVFAVLSAMVSGNYFQLAGFARGSAAVTLILVALILLALPPLLGALVLGRIVTRRLGQLQREREQELIQADQQRSQFMTDIAHDLRTPLMAISGMAHALADGVVHDEAQRDEYLRSMCDKADKMGGLVSSVFEYTKLGSGAWTLERERVDLPQLLLREAATAYTDIEEAGMSLSVEVDEDRCLVDADPTQLARVVANLLTNAVRHNTGGTEIALLLVRQAGVAYVVVADSGAPIEDDPSDLFQPFSRGDKARSATGGSGLGLSICKRIADMHGFDLALTQPYGRFSKAFSLRCPIVG